MAARAAPRYVQRLSLGVAVICLSLTVFLGLRTYGSFLLLRSAHDVSEGGLAVALAECCISSENAAALGARIDLENGLRPDAWLFGESHARMVVSVRRRHLTQLREIARREEE